MKIMGMGLDYTTHGLLIHPIDELEFAQRLEKSLGQRADELGARTDTTNTRSAFRREIELTPGVDLRDPKAAGWTFVVNGDDPDLSDIVDTLRPLAELRGMADPSRPLIFRSDDDWGEWMIDNYTSVDTQSLPHYVMVVGGPDQVPFHFQALFDTAASVGRVDLPISDLKAYVDKLIRLETAAEPGTLKQAVVFAPDAGQQPDGQYDPTYFSRHYMAEPLAAYIETKLGFQTTSIMGDDATKANFVNALTGAQPALVYTASHGLGAPDQELDIEKVVNGAICCQQSADTPELTDWLFMGQDVPIDQPFMEGAVLFQFACFGYGTPAESDFMHWLGQEEINAKADFVAALPKHLLAHPRGPIAFVGHVDTAWLHGFDDPNQPFPLEVWDKRISPFVQALNRLLTVEPVGRAMGTMNERYSTTNAILTGTYDKLQRGRMQPTPEFWSKLAETFITRSDAQNYMVFGDPGARVRISAD
jgi:hypothetical protein